MTVSQLGRRPQLAEEVAAQLRTRIMSAELRPGDFVRLDETAAGLGVSVTPVREALLTLRGEGLVDLVPRRGYVVSPMSRSDVEDIFWLQATLARQLLQRAIPRFDDDDLRQLDELIETFSTADSTDAVVFAQYSIYRKINLVADSDKLARFLSSAVRYMPYRLYAEDADWRHQALEWNRSLAVAIRTGETTDALDAVDREFADGARRLISHLERSGVWDDEADGADTGGAADADATGARHEVRA